MGAYMDDMNGVDVSCSSTYDKTHHDNNGKLVQHVYVLTHVSKSLSIVFRFDNSGNRATTYLNTCINTYTCSTHVSFGCGVFLFEKANT